MKKQTKKLIAPIIITILIICYLLFYMSIGIFIDEFPSVMKMLLLIIPIGFIILTICMLFERIKEIKGGEEDDLSKY